MLSRAELEFLSVFYYIKDSVLARDFSQEVNGDPLTYDPTLYDGVQRTDYVIVDYLLSQYGSLPIEDGRGWLSFDLENNNPCQIYNPTTSSFVTTYNTPFSNNVYSLPLVREYDYIKVRDQNNNLLDRSWYSIDYNKGRIRFPCSTTPSGVVNSGILPSGIDYRFHSVATVDGWPNADNIPKLPFVAIYNSTDAISGYQLGPGAKFTRGYTIDIFGSSSSNRRSIIDSIKAGIFQKHAPVIDFNRAGFPLNQNGTINEDFITSINYDGKVYNRYFTLNPGNGTILYFIDIEVNYNTSPRGNLSNAMSNLGTIRFKTVTYTDRDPELVGKFSGLEEPLDGFDSLIKKNYNA